MCGQSLQDMWAALVMSVENRQPDRAEYIAEYALEVRADYDVLFNRFDMWGRSEFVCWTIYAKFARAEAREHKAMHSSRAEEYGIAADAARAQYMRLWREGYTC